MSFNIGREKESSSRVKGLLSIKRIDWLQNECLCCMGKGRWMSVFYIGLGTLNYGKSRIVKRM